MAKRFFITGGAGFIGSNIAAHCVKSGAEVTVFDNLDPFSGANPFNLEHVNGSLVMHRKSILNIEALKEGMAGHDIIINCAASTSHGLSMSSPYENIDVNVKGTLNVLEAMRAVAPKAHLIYFGTTTQFGRTGGKRVDENFSEFPIDIYSANKSLGEKYALIYGRHYGLKVTAVRLSNIYGPRAAIHTPSLTFNNYFLGQAFQGNPITVYGDGAQIRNMLYVDDAVSVVMDIIHSNRSNGEVFIACGEDHLSVREIAHAIVDVVGKGSVKHVPWPDDAIRSEIGDAYLDNGKCKRVLGWRPKVKFSDGLERTRDYFSGRLAHYLKKT
jgi:UDP-glucose 4-epimerase